MSGRTFTDPQELYRTYLILRSGLSGLQGQSIGESVGILCAYCEGPPTRVGYGPKDRRQFKQVCTDCRRDWAGVETSQCRQHTGFRGDRTGDRIDAWRRVEPVFTGRPRTWKGHEWEFALLCLEIYLDPISGSFEGVVKAGPEKMPGALWTISTVRTAIEKVTLEIDRRGKRAGLIHGGGQ